jgi:hypothetical protein
VVKFNEKIAKPFKIVGYNQQHRCLRFYLYNQEIPTSMNYNTENQNNESMVEMFDEGGEKSYISRTEYKDKVLPHNLQLHWDKPDELASFIINSFNDGFYTNVEKAALRLVEIDNIPERSICLYGTMLLNTQRYLEAEEFFLNYLQDNPRHPYILTNLAKAQDFLSKKSNALILLEESLSADPNQENAIEWWQAIKKEELESEGMSHELANIYAFELADKRFGGWIAKLWLGSNSAAKKDCETARKFYEGVLKDEWEWEPSVLTRISKELGVNGFTWDAIELVAPLYDPHKHEMMTGLNLLQAYLELKHVLEGQQLLKVLYDIYNPTYAEQLSWYKLEFLKLIELTKTSSEEDLQVKMEFINYPLWCYGWNIKHGFDSSKANKKIAIFQFALESEQKTTKISFDVENIEGQLARALPLFLLENIYYGTDASATVLFPVCKEEGHFILYNDAPSTKQILKLLNQGYTGVVTGTITSNKLKVTYWNLLTKTQKHQVFSFDFNEPEKTISLIEKFVFKSAEILFDPDFKKDKKGFQAIPHNHRRDYLMLISQHITLYTAMKFTETIGMHHLIRGLLKLAKDTETIQTQLNLISVIHLCISYNSEAIKDYNGVIFRWLDNITESANSLNAIAKKTANAYKKYCSY